jgi:hypothetical protein
MSWRMAVITSADVLFRWPRRRWGRRILLGKSGSRNAAAGCGFADFWLDHDMVSFMESDV